MTNYTWSIRKLFSLPKQDGLKNVVHRVNWQLDATDGEFKSMVHGFVDIEMNSSSQFTDYMALTEQQVIDWVIQTLGESQIESFKADLQAEIDAKTTPANPLPDKPWN